MHEITELDYKVPLSVLFYPPSSTFVMLFLMPLVALQPPVVASKTVIGDIKKTFSALKTAVGFL